MLKKDSLVRMAEVRSQWCVSIYMPINEAEPKKNRIRLKKLMKDAENKLHNLGVIPLKVARLLGPVEMLLDNTEFWKDRKEGFAAFFTPDSFVWYSLRYQFDELVVVTDRFHLKPLIRNATETRRFHLLTLSRKQIKLFEASELGMNEIYLKGIPKYISAVLNSGADEKIPQLAADSNGSTVFREQDGGGIEDDKKSRAMKLFRKVDKAVKDYLKDDEAPLILAGAESLQPIYREANTYSHIVNEAIAGDVDSLTPKQLLKKVLPEIKPFFRRKREEAVETYRRQLGRGLASNDLSRIFKAAKDGRIKTLFVPVGKQEWGNFDAETDEVQVHRQAKPGDKDLLCVASTRTLLRGGEVFVVLPEQMPDKSSIAAVLRY